MTSSLSHKKLIELFINLSPDKLKVRNPKSSSMSLSFDANEIRLLSYAETICIRDLKSELFTFVTPNRSSVTTNKHISLVKELVPSGLVKAG